MNAPYFTPRFGKNWEAERVLIISESTYDWLDDEGESHTPQPSHPSDSVAWNVEDANNQYFRSMNRALCRVGRPSAEQVLEAWDQYAYTVYVQKTVGWGAGVRPSPQQWNDAAAQFLPLLERLRPSKVVVTGKDLWKNMPSCSAHLSGDLQAYKLSNGQLIWCLAVPHPANRTEGFRWEAVGEYIQRFKAMTFPAS
jgi:hypothetical protein